MKPSTRLLPNTTYVHLVHLFHKGSSTPRPENKGGGGRSFEFSFAPSVPHLPYWDIGFVSSRYFAALSFTNCNLVLTSFRLKTPVSFRCSHFPLSLPPFDPRLSRQENAELKSYEYTPSYLELNACHTTMLVSGSQHGLHISFG